MHGILREYSGAAQHADEAARRNQQGLIPKLKSHQGFRQYAAFASEQGDIISFTVYDDAEAARRSAELVGSWVKENLADLIPRAPEVFQGTVGAHLALHETPSLYCVVRKASNLPPPTGPLGEGLLDAVKDMPGFKGAYLMRSVDDPTKAATIWFCDTRENAMAVHDAALARVNRMTPQIKVRTVGTGPVTIRAVPCQKPDP